MGCGKDIGGLKGNAEGEEEDEEEGETECGTFGQGYWERQQKSGDLGKAFYSLKDNILFR